MITKFITNYSKFPTSLETLNVNVSSSRGVPYLIAKKLLAILNLIYPQFKMSKQKTSRFRNIRDKRILFVILGIITLCIFIFFTKDYSLPDLLAATNSQQGTYSVVVEDDFANNKSKDIHTLITKDNKILKITNPGKLPLNIRSGDTIIVQGTVNAKKDLTIKSAQTLRKSATGKSVSLSNVAVRVFPIAVKKDNTEAYSKAHMENVLNGAQNPISVNTFMKKVSKNKFQFSKVLVHDWFRVDPAKLNNPQVCDLYDLNEIIGYVDNNFDVDVYDPAYQSLIFVIDSGCLQGGRAYARYETGQGYIYLSSDIFKEGVIAHEVAHNMDVHHANSYDCGAKQYDVSSKCKTKEYGSPFSVVGHDVYDALFREYNAAERVRLGWVNSGEVLKVTKSGKYTIYPLSEVSAKAKVLEIAKNDISEDEKYYIDFRVPNPPFDTIDTDLYDGGDVTGVGVQTAFTQTYNPSNPMSEFLRHTQAIDATPGSITGYMDWYKDFMDGRLVKPGQKFVDEINGVEVELLSSDKTKAEVQVKFIQDQGPGNNVILVRGKASTNLLKLNLFIRDTSTGKYIKVKEFGDVDTAFATYSYTDKTDKVIKPEDVRITYSYKSGGSGHFDIQWLDINGTKSPSDSPSNYSDGVWNKYKNTCSPGYPTLEKDEYDNPTRLSCADKFFQFGTDSNSPKPIQNLSATLTCDRSGNQGVTLNWNSEKNSTYYAIEYCDGQSCFPATNVASIPENQKVDGLKRTFTHIPNSSTSTMLRFEIRGKTYKYRVKGIGSNPSGGVHGRWSSILTVNTPANACRIHLF